MISMRDLLLDGKIKEQSVYFGSYRGVRFEVKCSPTTARADGETWTYDLRLPAAQIPECYRSGFVLSPEEDGKGRLHYAYEQSQLADLPWHGGITFYEVQYGPKGDVRGISAGCDYVHYGDEGHSYSETGVLLDAGKCIDALWEEFPELLAWCTWSGEWHHPSNGDWIGESFYGPAGMESESYKAQKAKEVTA